MKSEYEVIIDVKDDDRHWLPIYIVRSEYYEVLKKGTRQIHLNLN